VKILLGVTGSVATTLLNKLVLELVGASHTVKVVATEKSKYFFNDDDISAEVIYEEDEWPDEKYEKNMQINHIALRDWADLLLIAPLSANTLAKMANGICDNLLTCIARAWDPNKSVVVAPAMNTQMYKHPITKDQIEKLGHYYYNYSIAWPISKELACGDIGIGAMANISDIVKKCITISHL